MDLLAQYNSEESNAGEELPVCNSSVLDSDTEDSDGLVVINPKRRKRVGVVYSESEYSSGSDADNYAVEDAVSGASRKKDIAENHNNKRQPKHQRATRKLKRNKGEHYVTAKGVDIAARKCEKLDKCRMKCYGIVSSEDQKRIFDSY